MADIKCEVFGDEGTGANGRFALFSFIGFEPTKVQSALNTLDGTKQKFGVPSSARLHCRELFAGDKRTKTEWRVLKPKDPIEVCRYLNIELRQLRPLWAYGYVDMRVLQEFPNPTTMRISFPPREDSLGLEDVMPFGIGQAQRHAYLGAGWNYWQRFSGQARFWVDKDRTMLDWLNGKRGQAHNLNLLLPCSVDLPPEWMPMLEITDLFAYAAGRCLADDQRYGAGVFRAMHRRYGPVISKVTLDPTAFGADIDRGE